jgi:Xaa-Pro aminopeptidase
VGRWRGYTESMRPSVLWLGLMCALPAVQAAGGLPREEYRARREALAKSLPDGVTVIFGRTEKDADDLRTAFFQEPNFYYLTGWSEPGAVLLVEPCGQQAPREVLFLPVRNRLRERWTGVKVGPDDAGAAQAAGFETVRPVESLETELHASLTRQAKLYTDGEAHAAALKALAPLREVGAAGRAIARLRMRKSAREVELLQRSTAITLEAHRAAWQYAAPGLYEYQVAAAMTAVYFGRGCERSAYAPIAGSGPNSTVLHYSNNTRRMDAGELLLLDVGAECSAYAADVTRTIPLSGKFTPRQREIYDIVLGAEKAVIAAAKPGAAIGKNFPGSLYRIAYDYINSHGKDLHGEPLGKYFIHGISHHVGLDVHDAWDPEMPLEAGMVITVEPGIYIPEEAIGVRIEDMLLVTQDGVRVMSAALPREAAEIEQAMHR